MFNEKIDRILEWFCIILIIVLPLTAIGLQTQRPITGFGYSQIPEGSFMPGNRAEYPFNEYGIRVFNDTIATDNITGYLRPKVVYAYCDWISYYPWWDDNMTEQYYMISYVM